MVRERFNLMARFVELAKKCQSNGALLRCGGQDSNLRTDKEWDLNPPPLTKLGDPRAG